MTQTQIAEAAERAAFDAWCVLNKGEPVDDAEWAKIHASGDTHTKRFAETVLAAVLPLIADRLHEDSDIADGIGAAKVVRSLAEGLSDD